MKATEYLKHRASAHEVELVDIYNVRKREGEVQKGIKSVQDEVETYLEDGVLTDAEVATIRTRVGEVAGEADLSGLSAGSDVEAARERLFDILEDALDASRGREDEVGLLLQYHAAGYTNDLDAASKLEKSGFDADMAVIRNLIA